MGSPRNGRSTAGFAAGLGGWMMALGNVLQWLVPGRGRVLSPLEGNQP